ncbi:MAG: hypothetical protein WC673_00170 [Candidatus Paceibacterota bacterium]|jgi:hypothetical protein
MKKYITIFVLLGLFTGISAFAESSYDADTNANLGAAAVKIQVNSSAGNSNSASTSANTGVKADVNANVNVGESASTTASDDDSGSNGTEATIGSQVRIMARDIRGWDSTEKADFLASVKVAVEVRTSKDLENFAKGVLLKDDNIASVSADNDIVVAYKQKAKFLGFIPTTLNANVVATSKNDIKVKNPWYRFMFKVENEVNADTVKKVASERISADLDASASANAKAEIIAALIAGLEAQANMSAEVNGSL